MASESGADGDGTLPPESDRVMVMAIDDGAVDVLVVLDNSGSMGASQAVAAYNMARFAELERSLGGDVRIAFTTTDNGNPWCQGTGPEAGNLLMESCASHLADFVFEGTQTMDVSDESCLDLCPLDSFELEPTPIDFDSEPKRRPWIEFSPGADNLGEFDLEQVVQCATPQGINGCGFESTLESMHKALLRSSSPSDEAYRFVRPWAALAVVIVTDEVDCSADAAWDEIFFPDGERVFWSDPMAPAPTSAVCWNAGVECENQSGDLGACHPQNFDVHGNVTTAANAVMVSLTRYIEGLEAIEQEKKAYRPEGSVSVALIAGVPGDYSAQTGLVYTRGSASGDFIDDFGVDPGCSNSMIEAVPPVRLRALAERFPFGDRSVIHSVCEEDYGPALEAIAASLSQSAPQACVPGCLADVDSGTAGTQVQCDVVMSQGERIGRDSELIPECGSDEPTEPCYRLRLDDPESPCPGQGFNAELELVRPEGFTFQGELTIEAACEMAPADSC